MADIQYTWPSKEKASVLGHSVLRLDGLEKSVGAAKYTYDINLKNQLIAQALGSPYGHCKIKSIDIAPAIQVKGVVHVELLRKAGDELQWNGELIAMVAAESEGAAGEGVAALKVDYEVLPSFTHDENLAEAKKRKLTTKAGGKIELQNEPGDDDDEEEFEAAEIERLFKESAYVVEGYYGVDAIAHCCLEPHGSTVEWNGDKLKAYHSTQNVSGTDEGFATALNITSDDVEVECNFIGGGFGSKFAADYWSVAAARVSKETGRPVKFMLSRDQELKIAGNRPSGYINVRLGADKNGVVQIWDSHHWGTAGTKGRGVSQSVIPYVFRPKNFRRLATGVKTNTVGSRAWRAPNHPQACAMTQTAYDDLAAQMGVSSYDIFMRNLDNISSRQTADVYRRELEIAAKLMDWKAKWHPHGKGEAQGSIVEGMGIALHEWGGVANNSSATIRIHPDGGVESFCGTQELGTGTRTACAMVVAETFGLAPTDIKVHIGNSKLPVSGASGGSTTIGAISESHRRASLNALAKLFESVAGKLSAKAEQLEAVGGVIRVKGDPTKSIGWREACGSLGLKPLEASASHKRGDKSSLSSEGVGGVQMAHVAVDRETGVVRMKKYVAVQDMGLVVNPVTAESQIYGAVIMGISYALYEHRLTDPATGAFINAEMADYQLPRIGDIGEIVVELFEPEDQRQRGVIGLGEPPVISPGAAISNAVANALGVRVPVLPLVPERVLDALKAGKA